MLANPDWEDVGTVYERMQSLQLFKRRARPNDITGHIFSAAVFARADRCGSLSYDLREFIEMYCECKRIDHEEFMDRIHDYLVSIGHWVTDPITILEVLSRL